MLDDATVDRIIRVFTQQKDDLPLYEEQAARWAKTDLTESQRQELAHVNGVLAKLHEVADAILALAEELRQGTIDRILSKSDVELGLEFLMGKRKL